MCPPRTSHTTRTSLPPKTDLRSDLCDRINILLTSITTDKLVLATDTELPKSPMARIPEGIVLIADEEDVKPKIIEIDAAVAAGLYNPAAAATESDDVMILDPVSKKWTRRRPSVHVPFMPRKTDWDLVRSRKLAKAKAAAARRPRRVATRPQVTSPVEADSSAAQAVSTTPKLVPIGTRRIPAPLPTIPPPSEPSFLPDSTDVEMSYEPTELALSSPACQQEFSRDIQTQMLQLQLDNHRKDQELAGARQFLCWQMLQQAKAQLEQDALRLQVHRLEQREPLASGSAGATLPEHVARQDVRTQPFVRMNPADWSAFYKAKAAREQER